MQLADMRAKSKLDTWIVNADSMQVYSDIPILSAAPGNNERKKHPHKLYGEWDGSQTCSAADWARRAQTVIAEAHAAKALPVLVGGTGMYLKVLIEGIAPIPEIAPEIRAIVREMDTQSAYAALQIEDPERAIELEPGDSQRIGRALEVKRATGVTLGDWQKSKTGGIGEEVDLHAVVHLPERQWVYDRCDTRFKAMIEDCAIEEVEALLAREIDPALPVMRAIGVPDIAAFLREEFDREEAIKRGSQATRNYAKRQFTWFRNQTPDEWRTVETEKIDIDGVFASLLRD